LSKIELTSISIPMNLRVKDFTSYTKVLHFKLVIKLMFQLVGWGLILWSNEHAINI